MMRHAGTAGWLNTLEPIMHTLARVLFFAALLAQVYVAWHFRSNTWDDAAITLGFARTLAMTGRVEPTPGSGIVEGYSTTLWMLCMAVTAKVVGRPYLLLVAAKVATLLLNMANLVALRVWLGRWNAPPLPDLVAGVLGLLFMFYETLNGMEAPLALFLLLTLSLLRNAESGRAQVLFIAAGSAFLLTRWEAAWLLVPFLLLEPTRKRQFKTALIWAGVFVCSNLVRWLYFGSFMPNTIIAKRGVPYLAESLMGEVHRHINEPHQILHAILPFILISVLALVLRNVQGNWRQVAKELGHFYKGSFELRFCGLFVVFSLFLSLAIGVNWGPPMRSFFYAWPFLLTLVMAPIFSLTREKWTGIARSTAGIAFCTIAVLGAAKYFHELTMPNPPAYMPNATIGYVFPMVPLLEHVSQVAQHPHLLYAGPDMGAVILFAPDLHVIDLGLLCDKRLAHERFAGIGHYVLEERKPDVIMVHGMWTRLTNLGAYPVFFRDYRPVVVTGKQVFMRRDLIQQIPPENFQEKQFNVNNQTASDPELALAARFGTYLIER